MYLPESTICLNHDWSQYHKDKLCQVHKQMIPWVEKYRPSAVEDLVLDGHVLEKLRSFTSDNLPNLLCVGEPGVGKTSTAIAIAKRLCGDSYLELNASDNRGINMISDMVSSFCRSVDSENRIIILDEADNITKKAQQQLVNFMENYPKFRIFFTCNDFDQIIEPLQSRCMLMNFPSPTKDQVVMMLSKVFEAEQVTWEVEAVHRIIDNVNWDMRACINACQAISVSYNNTISLDTVRNYFCVPSMADVYKLVTMESLSDAVEHYLTLNKSGISSIDVMTAIIHGLQTQPLPHPLDTLPPDKVYTTLRQAHTAYYRMLQTVDSINQIVCFLHQMIEN